MRRFDRPAIDLDGTWEFTPDAEQILQARDVPPGQEIEVPGCWEAQVDRPYHIITAWYRRTFEAPPDWAGEAALLRFGAVMYHGRMWLNGHLLGEHEGGYTEFTLPTGGALVAGTNELLVRVTNPLNAISDYPALAVERTLLAEEWSPDLPLTQAPHGNQTWYSSQSGIWRSVRVERVGPAWFDAVRALPDLGREQIEVRWALGTADEAPAGTRGWSVRSRLEGPDGSPVGSPGDHPLDGGLLQGAFDLPVPSPVTWGIGRPNLYTLHLELVADGDAIDAMTVRFGMRSIAVRDGRVLLNGEPIHLRGALDQDIHPETITSATSRAALEEQFTLTAEMGLNLLRCHIKSPDPLYAEIADERGMLLWCELPNWTVFSDAAALRGQRTLEDMVVALGNHPSIIAWTIINEDWGTDLRYEARDRLWLRGMVDWLRALDPSRLIVDNSACDTPQTPNFHVKTDLLDFHTYFVSPDNAHRWRSWIEEFARRPAFLWSPFEDDVRTGHEPLILSEFGSWGLPDPDRVAGPGGRQPWWFSTGQTYYRPAGVRRRFGRLGLDRIWPDLAALAVATQWHQFENLQYEIAQMRRHDSIAGYVVTELTDATWEANGLLDIQRGRKAYHDQLSAVNGDDVAVTDLARRDLAGGAAVDVPFWVSSYGAASATGAIAWQLELDGQEGLAGTVDVDPWPRHGSLQAGSARIEVPAVPQVTDGRLVWTLTDDAGRPRGGDALRIAVLPSRPPGPPRRVAVHDPLGMWSINDRVRSLGHEVVGWSDADVLVTSGLDERVVDHADAGGRVLVLVRTRDAVPESVDLARRIDVHLRRYPHAGWPGQRSPWEGDWVTAFSWMAPELQAGLPVRNPLDFAYTEVLPDHVLLGYDPTRHGDEVAAGMFVGWVHTPAALEWCFRQGSGSIALTTFRVAPECGPVATTLLDRLIDRAARGRATPKEDA